MPVFNCAGVILVGGRSRRMGTDKALQPLPGGAETTFVEHLAGLLSKLCSEVALVVRDAAQHAQYDNLALPGVRTITDRRPDAGPLMGLYSALSAIQSSHALVTAVDMPYIQPEMVSFLLSQSLDDSPIIPIVADNPQVLLAVYPRTLFPVIEKLLLQGRRGPRALLEVVPARYIAEEELRQIDPQLRSFVNVNTPQDLANL
jgi:molybdopterin-guanine dinucleotide biosynthesis protein A